MFEASIPVKHRESIVKHFLILLVFCATMAMQAQKNSLFSDVDLSRQLSSAYLDSANYYAEKNPLRAIDFINEAIEQSIYNNDKATESAAYLILGNIQQGLRQHDLAIENYRKCLNVSAPVPRKFKSSSRSYDKGTSRIQNPSTQFQAYKQMAASYLELNDTENALRSITACLDLSAVSSAEMSAAKRLQALVLSRRNSPQESFSILNDLLAQEKQAGSSSGEAETYLVMGDIYLEQKNEEKAIEMYTNAKLAAEKNNDARFALKANEQLAKIFRKQKNVAKEVEARNSNIRLNNSINNYQGVVKENIAIGNAFLNTNQSKVAESYFDKGLEELQSQGTVSPVDKNAFIRSNDLDETSQAYKKLAEEYLQRKDPSKALEYFKKYETLQDSVQRIRSRELYEALNLSNRLGKNQQRIELLEKERSLSERSVEILKKDQDLKEEQLAFRNVIIGVLVVFLLFMLLAGYFVIRSSAGKRRANQELALRSLRGQMNPHFIFNALNSVNHYISQNDERRANRYLSDFSKLMRMVMDSSRHSLVPLSEELEMLRLYLQLEHTRFSDKFDFTIRVSEQLSDTDFELPPMLIQPYLENAIWHGLRYLDHKGGLSIEFKEEQKTLVVDITDNGIGRNRSLELKTPNQKKQASIGMQNIENRIGIMNDLFSTNIRVDITDAFPGEPNCGTRIRLFIPQQKRSDA